MVSTVLDCRVNGELAIREEQYIVGAKLRRQPRLIFRMLQSSLNYIRIGIAAG